MVTKWLYPEVTDPSKLTADQKETIASIVGLGTAGIGGAIGDNYSDIAMGGIIGENATNNNFSMGSSAGLEISAKIELKRFYYEQNCISEGGLNCRQESNSYANVLMKQAQIEYISGLEGGGDIILSIVPVIGDAKAFHEAYESGKLADYLIATAGLVAAGDILNAALKYKKITNAIDKTAIKKDIDDIITTAKVDKPSDFGNGNISAGKGTNTSKLPNGYSEFESTLSAASNNKGGLPEGYRRVINNIQVKLKY